MFTFYLLSRVPQSSSLSGERICVARERPAEAPGCQTLCVSPRTGSQGGAGCCSSVQTSSTQALLRGCRSHASPCSAFSTGKSTSATGPPWGRWGQGWVTAGPTRLPSISQCPRCPLGAADLPPRFPTLLHGTFTSLHPGRANVHCPRQRPCPPAAPLPLGEEALEPPGAMHEPPRPRLSVPTLLPEACEAHGGTCACLGSRMLTCDCA